MSKRNLSVLAIMVASVTIACRDSAWDDFTDILHSYVFVRETSP